MKRQSKVIFILSFLLLAICTIALGQPENNVAEPDDGMNLFLLSFVTLFFCATFGAAIIGAIAAALILFFLFALISFGALSTSFAIGLYKKSFYAGFKSLLLFTFGISCAAIGSIGLLIIGHGFNLPVSSFTMLAIGTTGGFLGGVIMALSTFHVFLWLIKQIAKKLNLA